LNINFEAIKMIVLLLSILIAPLMAWMAVTGVFGLRNPRKLKRIETKNYRFAVVICARNEEQVIGNLLDSLNSQDYSGDSYDIFVIADNCTDQTAHEAKKHGATVFERFNNVRKGKGFALQWGLSRIMDKNPGKYDAICVFDADNLASANFLTEMNACLCSGADVAQGYRDSKNIHDSWVSEVYSVYWLMLMRFYYTARHNMGLSGMVGGTGFAFKTAALCGEGWNTFSMTEDVEFSIQQICKGHRIIPARSAIFYDEQPTTFGASMKQRFRWMVGGIQCIPLYLKTILTAVKNRNYKVLDMAWYVFFIPANGLTVPINILSVILAVYYSSAVPMILPVAFIGIALTWLLPMAMAAGVLYLENRKIRPMLRAVVSYPAFILTMGLAAFAALVWPRTNWAPIAHKSNFTIQDVEGGVMSRK